MIFTSDKRNKSEEHQRLYAGFEIAYTVVDFSAAALFIVGSIMFFSESLMIPGTWCFLVGSVCFALKPTLRLVRELQMARLDKLQLLAKRGRDW
ncbi:YrhK family protein [Arthrobacter sp.]|uniref:YrhK family protein n=1 Tax=Arthrobacter sp. TaxID=1667 RepID=UPI003A8DBB33